MKTFKQLNVLTKRIVKQNLTSADTLITSIVMPICILLFFVYVMGGNIQVAGVAGNRDNYLKYAMPGFLLMSMLMSSAYTALRINNDKTRGVMTRFLSLPIKRWIILGAHILASIIFMLLSTISVLVVGMVFGYRPQGNFGDYLLLFILIVLFALAITVLAIPFSLSAKDYAGAGAFSYLLIFLLFISSAFIPVAGMAKPIRIFAENQPMTPIVETAKHLLNGTYTLTDSSSLLTIVWLSSLILIFALLSFKRYQQIFVNV